MAHLVDMPIGPVALATGLFLGLTTRRRVVNPRRALTPSARRGAGGELATPAPPLGAEEVRALVNWFDDMRARLRQAMEALALEQRRYQRIVESMADAVVTTDTEGRITDLNRAAQQLTGWGLSHVVG